MAKLCLGTVQFGMKYGVNNQIGRQPTYQESFDMIKYAFDNGIEVIDTAAAYGEAETILGLYNKEYGIPKGTRIISKLRPNVIEKNEKDIYGVVRKELETSLNKVGVSKLDGYLLHTPEYIYNTDIIEAMVKVKQEGLVQNIGISIYDIKEGYAAIETGVLDYIQLPYSILDQRGIKSGFIKDAKKNNIEIYTRSAFLQGLFMMNKDKIPQNLKKAVPYLDVMDKVIKKYNVDKLSAILAFVDYEMDIDYLVFGVESKDQIIQDIDKIKDKIPEECILELKTQIDNVDNSIIFPSLWSNGRKAE